ncbi:MAG TPA: hypothetical protein VFF12_16890 [Myxococcaceae bacterium]|nr:hypothetical protein [Myxococcaceae bacterium]
MAVNGFKRWITIAALAAAPVAFAQDARAMDQAQQRSVEAVLNAGAVKSAEERQIDALQKEVDALRSTVNAQQEREDRRQELQQEPDPLWP